MIKAVIVEDEQNSRDLLRNAVENFIDGIQIVGEADSVVSAISLINSLQPDLLFLDIELPDGRGFDIIDQTQGDYKVVFVTAYDDYAINAIRYAAIDYLVKPLDLDDLEAAVKRIKSLPPITQKNLSFLHEKLQSTNNSENKIMVPSHSGYTLLDINQIISVEADANYVFFTLGNGKKHIASHSLNYYEDLLPDNKFFRIHKSHIINFTKIISVESGRAGKAYLKNGEEFDIAARRKAAFLACMKRYTIN